MSNSPAFAAVLACLGLSGCGLLAIAYVGASVAFALILRARYGWRAWAETAAIATFGAGMLAAGIVGYLSL